MRKEFGIRPVGLGARDTLRLEAAYSLYGHELSDTITPVEAGLGWLVTGEDEYIGRAVLTAQKEKGAPRTMVCFELEGRGVPREHCAVMRTVWRSVRAPRRSRRRFKKNRDGARKDGALGIGDSFSLLIRDNPVPAKV